MSTAAASYSLSPTTSGGATDPAVTTSWCGPQLTVQRATLAATVAAGIAAAKQMIQMGRARSAAKLFDSLAAGSRQLGRIEGMLTGCNTAPPASATLASLMNVRGNAAANAILADTALGGAWIDGKYSNWLQLRAVVQAKQAEVAKYDLWISRARAMAEAEARRLAAEAAKLAAEAAAAQAAEKAAADAAAATAAQAAAQAEGAARDAAAAEASLEPVEPAATMANLFAMPSAKTLGIGAAVFGAVIVGIVLLRRRRD